MRDQVVIDAYNWALNMWDGWYGNSDDYESEEPPLMFFRAEGEVVWPLMGDDLAVAYGVSWRRQAIKCDYESVSGARCQAPAGGGTDHLGVGHCSWHRGRRQVERCRAAWLMAHGFARELNVTPWEGLLTAVRVAAGKLDYAQQKVAEATSDLELEGRIVRREQEDGTQVMLHPDTGEMLGVGGFRDLSFWVSQADRWHERLARVSKMAVDAGVAERIVEAQILQVQLMTRPVEAALAALGLSPEQEAIARQAMRGELVKMEHEHNAVLEGEAVGTREIGS